MEEDSSSPSLPRGDGREPAPSRPRRVNKVPGGVPRRDRARGQWPGSCARALAREAGRPRAPAGRSAGAAWGAPWLAQRRLTAPGQPLGPRRVKLHRPRARIQSRKWIPQTPAARCFDPTHALEIDKSLVGVAVLVEVNRQGWF